jgi:hypothetical protein
MPAAAAPRRTSKSRPANPSGPTLCASEGWHSSFWSVECFSGEPEALRFARLAQHVGYGRQTPSDATHNMRGVIEATTTRSEA